MRGPRTLSAKLGAIGGSLLLAALLSIGLTLWVTWQLEGGAAAVNEAGRMRMQAWRLAQVLPSADRAHVESLMARFDDTLTLLQAGDPSRPLFVPKDAATVAAFVDVHSQWQLLRRDWLARVPSQQEAEVQTEAFAGRIDTFVSAIEHQLARWTATLHLFQLMMVALVIGSAVALLYAAYLFIFNPLSRLQAGLARLQAGDMSARVERTADDEFGAVADGFNTMAATLQELYESLEGRVREKTLHLEAERARLAALYEAAAFVARAGTLDELAQGFARQLRRATAADAVAVRWSDEDNGRYVLLAGDGLPTQMIEDEHCVTTGECLCGQAQARATTRVIPIHSQESTLLGHCARAGFATVVGVPVRLHERLVGEIDLFYRTDVRVAPEDRTLWETLASHLAGAIESLRAAALDRESAVSEERSMLASELHDSIAQSLAFLKIQVGLLRDAIGRRDDVRIGRTLDELDAGVRESLSDVRELLVHFRTRTNTEDIVPALQLTLQKFEHQTGLETHLDIAGQGLPLPPDVQVQVLHVVQEALSNVRKHAGAHEVWVEVRQAPAWRVEVRDDGSGFEWDDRADDETHVGLRIMRERAERIGATVEVASVRGEGTRVVLQLPPPQRLAA